MVQFNLLPDVKVEFIKARRQKHLLTVVTLIVSAVCVGIFAISFIIAYVGQKQYLRILDNDIKTNSETLKKVPDINKILTVQNQLGRLTELHEHKPVTSRAFSYLTQITPKDASLNKLTLDYSVPSITVGGTAPNLDTVRIFTESLKLTKYETQDGTDKGYAFSEVVLSSFSTAKDGTAFTITMKFNPIIFDGTQENLQLIVPPTAGASKEDLFKENR